MAGVMFQKAAGSYSDIFTIASVITISRLCVFVLPAYQDRGRVCAEDTSEVITIRLILV